MTTPVNRANWPSRPLNSEAQPGATGPLGYAGKAKGPESLRGLGQQFRLPGCATAQIGEK